MYRELESSNVPSTLIPIINYKTERLVVDCLESLATDMRVDSSTRVVLVDNNSPDGSGPRLVEAVRARCWSAWCEVRLLPNNGGFAYGNNAALPADAKQFPEYVILLNPDTVVRPGAIQTLIDFADHNPTAGIIGSRLEDPDGTPQISAFRFPSILAELEMAVSLGLLTRLLRPWMLAPPVRDVSHRCDWVAGACMLIRREVFERIGMMDEGYFMYYEEVDFCLRAARAGWECWYVPAARVVHLVGQSSGVTDTKKPPKRLPAYWFESRQRYFQKNHGRLYAAAADAAWTIGYALHTIFRVVRRRPYNDPPQLFRDFLRHAFRRIDLHKSRPTEGS